jgi:phosphoribosylglycinamide formyltransferase-1
MKLAILVSGAGTNLQALLDAQARGELAPGEIAVVVSNKPGVPALSRAEAARVPTEVVASAGLDRATFEAQLVAVLERHGVEAIVLAGFMRILTAELVERYRERIINTHPSLLPAFPGHDAPAQAIAHGVKISGVTIHFVDATLDGGPIIAQVAVDVHDDDDAATLHARIQREEHRLLPSVVQRLAAGHLSCQGRRVMRASGRAQ